MSIKIEQRPSKDYKGGFMTPTSVTIHNTNTITTSQGRTMAQQYADAQRNGNMKGCYVHFYADKDSIVQCLPLDMMGVHAGDKVGNQTSIAIEGIGLESYNNVILLLDYLLDLLPKSITIKKHKDWSGKNCPEYFLPIWDKFINDVNLIHKPTHQFNKGIQFVKELGISDGSRPDDNLTRGEFFEILYRYHNKIDINKK